MDRTLAQIFGKSETTADVTTKISEILRETIICQTISRQISLCYNMSDRFLRAVISSQTGCYNMSDTFYAKILLLYCAIICQTIGNYLILPAVICKTKSVIICQTVKLPNSACYIMSDKLCKNMSDR